MTVTSFNRNSIRMKYNENSLLKEDFDKLFNLLYPSLVVYANKFIDNIHECEGIVQEIFIKFWLNIYSSSKEINAKSYLYRAVHNACIDQIRHCAVKEKRIKDYKYMQNKHADIKDIIAESELKVRIEKAINKLPHKCRKIFLMSRDDELTYKQIAQELDISIKTVETQIGKALKILRKQLSEFIISLFLFTRNNKG